MSNIKNLLVPGGLGFIGSNTIVGIIEQTNTNVIILDDYSNCYEDVLERIRTILRKKFDEETISQRICHFKMDILALDQLDILFKMFKGKQTPIDGIMHFAAKKAIGQSYQKPMLYYENNVVGSMNLFKMMQKHKECKNFIFSSSAGIYGNKDNCKQTDPANPTSPYGQSKACVQMLLGSLAKVNKDWKIISLRYFNPCGAHQTYLLGDQPLVHPNNLFPYIQEVVVGKRSHLNIFGSDYPTPDGTCIRDYIHITDLANGHIAALNKLATIENNIEIYNLGTGQGCSVLEVVKGFEKVIGAPVKTVMTPRRFGDVPKLLANVEKATSSLGWKATKTLEDMCVDSVNFIRKRYEAKNKA